MKTIEKVIKEAVSANKYKSGSKEVLQSVKGSKLVIVSKSLVGQNRTKIDEQAKSANVPVYEFDGNSVQLGKMCSKPFRITTIALKSGTDEEIKAIMSNA
jgi:large subunit ribosomal protein L30e